MHTMERRRKWKALLILVAASTAPLTQAFAPTAFVSFHRGSRLMAGGPTGSRTIPYAKSRIAMARTDNQEPMWKKAWNRLDTLESAGLKGEGSTNAPVLARGPGLKRALFWLGIAFLWKWYRARFINKIPVWDRQPQWNMVVTSREQEKELKAYTCKNCGSTLFIAKNREWFFKGDTGLGGLGCYTCGAKGEDNFVMDRDRIVEDVGDDDDYFDYERPLDFVTAAERRALMKEAQGDEDVANQMLIDSQKGEGGEEEQSNSSGNESIEDVLDIEVESKTTTADDEIKQEEGLETMEEELRDATAADLAAEAAVEEAESVAERLEEEKLELPEISTTEAADDAVSRKKKAKKKKKKPKSEKAPEVPKKESDIPLDDLDILGMDEF